MTVVLELVQKGQAFSSQYRGILANHLPMSLYALSAIGASDERLREFYEQYIKRLNPRAPSAIVIDATNWQSHLGQHAYHADYLTFFSKELGSRGLDQLLAHYLPFLVQSSGSGAFHGLIRTAYGIEFSNESEVIEGLAYWCVSYLRIPTAPVSTPAPSMLAALAGAVNDPAIPRKIVGRNILERMEKVTALPALANYLHVETISLADVAKINLRLYDLTQDFTILHAVTSTHALRLVLPYLADKQAALNAHWRNLLTALLTVSLSDETLAAMASKTPAHETGPAIPSWAAICHAAIQSDDDHVCKMVHSCMRENDAYNNPLYQRVAAKNAGLIS